MKSNRLFYHSKPSSKPVEPITETPIIPANWKDKYQQEPLIKSYKLEDSADDSELNRAIQLKSYDNTDIIEGKPGKIYYDKTNEVVKVFISETIGWVDLITSDLEFDIIRTKQIKSDTTTASDLTITTGTDKTLLLSTSVYNDANVGGMALRAGATTPPITQWVDNLGANTGVYGLGFAELDEANGSIEMPHDYKEGTDIVFHIHWGANAAPSGTDYVKWQLTYSMDFESTNRTTSPSTVIVIEGAYDTQYQHKRSDFPTITGTNFKIGDQIDFNIKRVAASGAAYAGVAIIETIGFHYQCDTLGSRLIGTK